jgi:hypothetical protein
MIRGGDVEEEDDASLVVSLAVEEGILTISSKNALALEGGVRRERTMLARDGRAMGIPSCEKGKGCEALRMICGPLLLSSDSSASCSTAKGDDGNDGGDEAKDEAKCKGFSGS